MEEKNNNSSLDSRELEEMRRQVGLLKEKLDRESLVNDKLMRNILTTKRDKIDRYLRQLMVLMPFTLALMYLDFGILFPLSTPFLVFTEVMLLAAGIFIYCNKRLLASADMAGGNLVEEAKKLVRFRKREIRYVCIGMPLAAVWVAWMLVYEFPRCPEAAEVRPFLTVGCLTGAVVGAIVGLAKFRTLLRGVNDIVRQIEEIS
ncbi:MAG: hypothetical protein UHL07_03765 [Bacteroidaceae bacterium]|nr:hypothetical protein [Bacteroidaceae bacterium]